MLINAFPVGASLTKQYIFLIAIFEHLERFHSTQSNKLVCTSVLWSGANSRSMLLFYKPPITPVSAIKIILKKLAVVPNVKLVHIYLQQALLEQYINKVCLLLLSCNADRTTLAQHQGMKILCYGSH